ncbi:hypothetical protein F4821DRAFT_242130 [Hypoxylon rubiginosum]|uniref:Uncharacterized protein n=1 Tax=Hypoxylon rubiginosum TaxID=110542 RepID=A0ACC0CW76_9PEZI|nr:hypothetical protein F4821DRAFT_242130 [Hypoxylon rubiginosum]
MALPPPPPGLDLTETRVPELFGSLLTTWIVATIVVALRFYAHRLIRTPFWREDWLVLGALVSAGVHVYTSLIYMVSHGVGRHIWVGSPDAAEVWATGLFISEVVYTLTVVMVKLSTLSFYWRLFASKRSIRIPIWILVSIVSAWGIAVLLITFFQCSPPRAFWDRYDPIHALAPGDYSCSVNTNNFFIGNSIPNIVSDACIVFLPLPYIWSLQMRRAQKIALGGIFLLGIFVTIISGVRLLFILTVDVTSPDITWNFSDTIIWTNTEGNLAIVGCCLPLLKPIAVIVFRGRAKLTSENSDPSSAPSASLGVRAKAERTLPSYLRSDVHTSVSRNSASSRPFVRLPENNSNGWQENDGGAVELQDLRTNDCHS